MMGCDLHCSYCQNWVTSQALRDPAAAVPIHLTAPEDLVVLAQREGARLVVSSYNEPLITAEWAVAVFREATAAGLACAFVSNGNATPEVLDFLRPWIIAYKVDLKSFDDRHYRELGGTLGRVTDTIRMLHERGFWVEVVTLIVPGFNDDKGELRDMARFLASISPDIPWHVTAFHPDYRMTDPPATTTGTLVRAAEMGAEEGLHFVYAGNLPGRVSRWENTYCPGCQTALIERFGYLIREYYITSKGTCPKCAAVVPGIWPTSASEVSTGAMEDRWSRMPRAVR
jgi:pyruvate formate lyase activating enzyme